MLSTKSHLLSSLEREAKEEQSDLFNRFQSLTQGAGKPGGHTSSSDQGAGKPGGHTPTSDQGDQTERVEL